MVDNQQVFPPDEGNSIPSLSVAWISHTRYHGRKSMVLSLDLKAFIIRACTLKLYRQALRVAQRAPIHARAELRQTMRQEMEKNRHCDDKQRIRFLISEGLRRLKELDEMLDMQGH